MNTNKKREKEIYRITIAGTIANIFLLGVKFVAGVVGNSSAMIADAVHSVSDFATDVVVLSFVKVSNKPKDHDHNYGHGKFETLATAVIGFVLIFVAIGICWDAVERIWSVVALGKTLNSPEYIALAIAILSIFVKEILYQWTYRVGTKINSKMVKANAWHHRSDAFSSIATTIGIGGAIFLGEKWRILDPIAAVIVSIFIVKVAFKLLKSSLNELLEKSLPEEIEKEILSIIEQYSEAHDPHNLRTRCIGNSYAIEVHIRFNKNTTVADAHDVVSQIEMKLREKYGENTHISTHIEPVK